MRLRFSSIFGLTAILAANLLVVGCAKKSTDDDTNNMASDQNTSTSSGGSSNAKARRSSEPRKPVPPPPPATIDVTVPAGTNLSVIINQTISSKTNNPGDRFDASLAAPIIVDGRTIFAKNSVVTGKVTSAVPSGRLKTPAELAVTLVSIQANGSTYNLATQAISSKGGSHKNRNLGFIGGGGAGGALIGGLAGGGKGALIGGLIGAGAGTAGAAATGKKDISIAAETRMSFVTSAPVTVTVKNTPAAPAGAQDSSQN